MSQKSIAEGKSGKSRRVFVFGIIDLRYTVEVLRGAGKAEK